MPTTEAVAVPPCDASPQPEPEAPESDREVCAETYAALFPTRAPLPGGGTKELLRDGTARPRPPADPRPYLGAPRVLCNG